MGTLGELRTSFVGFCGDFTRVSCEFRGGLSDDDCVGALCVFCGQLWWFKGIFGGDFVDFRLSLGHFVGSLRKLCVDFDMTSWKLFGSSVGTLVGLWGEKK